MNIVDPIRDKDDIQAMKEYLREWNERNYLLFLFGINSGLRVGDILRIRVKDVQGWHIKIKEQIISISCIRRELAKQSHG